MRIKPRGNRKHPLWNYTGILAAILFLCASTAVRAEETAAEEAEGEYTSPLNRLMNTWQEWPPSQDFRITLEYRNYAYLEDEMQGDSRDYINEGRLRVEYDKSIRSNMRVYINALLQADDDDFTHGFVNDFEDDDLKRNYLNFTEAFLDLYFEDFDLRLGKQIVKWGKADVWNPTSNVSPTDYANLLDDDDIGVVAANFNYYWNDWNLQIIGVPGFTPTRLPPRGTRFSLIPPNPSLPVEDPELPANTIENAQFGVRLKTTYRGWDFSASYYDGMNDIPAATMRYDPFPMPVSIVPVYHRFRAVGGDFATTFDRWGFHGEAAYVEFDGDTEDARFQYVIGGDYTKSDILFDHDLFVILEYVGEDTTKKGSGLDTGTPLDRILTSALATNIRYEFTEYTRIEVRGAIDFYQGNDYYVQPQLVHDMTDNFEITVGFDILGGPRDTFFGQFREGDRMYVKLKYTF